MPPLSPSEQRVAFNYHFSAQAKAYLAGLTLTEVSVEDLERSGNFIRNAIRLARESRPQAVVSDCRDDAELKSIAIARMLLASCRNAYAARLFGEGLARQAVERLRGEEPAGLSSLLSQLFPSVSLDGETASLDLRDFLAGGGELAYAALDKGCAYLEREALFDLAFAFLAQRASDFSHIDERSIPPLVKEFSADLSAQLPQRIALSTGPASGKWLSQDCIKAVLAGVPEGKRFYGSMALAIACQKDGHSKDEAAGIMTQYAENCKRTSHDFTQNEALATLDWVYKHPAINLSCRKMMEQGLIDSHCANCPQVRHYGPAEKPRKK